VDEKDRCSIHVEYLKIAIALATALIAAGAAIYVDPTKIPTDQSRYFLLAGVSVFFFTLISSVLSIACLGNHLVHTPRENAAEVPAAPAAPAPTAIPAPKDRNRRARGAVLWANLSFFSLVIGAGLLGCFFAIRTFDAGGVSFERSIATAKVVSRYLTDATKGESAIFKSIELQGDSYRLVFQITPGTGSVTILTDALGVNVKSAARQ
jgi:hypothetical protein